MTDQYKTVAREMITKCKIQRSLFIAHVKETPTEEEARAFIAQVSNEHKQATHNCWAYRVGMGKNEISYFDDDGGTQWYSRKAHLWGHPQPGHHQRGRRCHPLFRRQKAGGTGA